MKGRVAYRGYQEPWNPRLAGGVEPLGIATLLTPADGARDGLKPAVTAPLSVFFAASSKASFFAAASSAAFFFAVASSVAFFTATSLAAFFFVATSSVAFFFAAASSVAFFFAAYSVAFFFLPPFLWPPLLQPHPQPLSLQQPLLPPSCRPQLSCRWTPRAPLPMPLLTRQASVRERLEGARRPLICPDHVPSSASAAEHHHRMILHRHYG
jgi:hypothetical protein